MDLGGVARVSVQYLRDFCTEALEATGVPADAAGIVADSLVQADACGLSSHGAVRLLPIHVRRLQSGATRPRPDLKVVAGRGQVKLLDADAGLGQVAGHRAMDMAVSMARASGIGLVGVRNSSHFGFGAFFVQQAVGHGMIGIALTNASPNMPPAGGARPFLGTNPMAIGVPCKEELPVVLDMSTSVVARGRIVMAQLAGEEIPVGWALDSDGLPTQDASAALEGSVLPVGGYKGSGLSLMVDVLCGVLTGAAFGPHVTDFYDQSGRAQNLGHMFAAVDVESFMPVPTFTRLMDQMVREVRAQPLQPGVERIFLPGEIEQLCLQKSRQEGIPISAAGIRELDSLASELAVRPLAESLSEP